MDPSLRNWGVAVGMYDLDEKKLVSITTLETIRANIPTGKQVRQNSKDLESAKQIFQGVEKHLKDASAIFVEVPHGSQSARAMASYGICVGVLGSMEANGYPFVQLTALEVKQAATGDAEASKKEMISAMAKKHPTAPWPWITRKGVTSISESQGEHMADAIAAIEAGIQSNQFKQSLSLMEAALKAQNASNS